MAHQQFWRAAVGRSLPVFVAAASSSSFASGNDNNKRRVGVSRTDCDASPSPSLNADHATTTDSSGSGSPTPVFREAGFQPKAEGYYADLFPQRQLWQPKVEYPQWDLNWDGRHPPVTEHKEEDRRKLREIRKHGITRHIILIRHGQYDESHKEDALRQLTQLGKMQADLTGRRLAEIMNTTTTTANNNNQLGPSKFKALRVSAMTRAKETADIIAQHLPGVTYAEPDPLLNEGRPCHHIPGTPVHEKTIAMTDDHHRRIEQAYQKYFYRSEDFPPPRTTAANDDDAATTASTSTDDDDDDYHKHEFEIIVCHANVIRYFLCRALQLPPEAWLRYCPFNCSMTYITIRPSGNVSCRMLGDIGHLPYDVSTFSKHVGFKW